MYQVCFFVSVVRTDYVCTYIPVNRDELCFFPHGRTGATCHGMMHKNAFLLIVVAL